MDTEQEVKEQKISGFGDRSYGSGFLSMRESAFVHALGAPYTFRYLSAAFDQCDLGSGENLVTETDRRTAPRISSSDAS